MCFFIFVGDGGAPLVCPVGGRVSSLILNSIISSILVNVKFRRRQWYVVGLVAWGIGCGTTVPGVYINVTSENAFLLQLLFFEQNSNFSF